MLAARRSLARARASAPSSSGILASEPVAVAPAQPLTIQVSNDLSMQAGSTLAGGRPQPSATVDTDLYRDPQSVVGTSLQ